MRNLYKYLLILIFTQSLEWLMSIAIGTLGTPSRLFTRVIKQTAKVDYLSFLLACSQRFTKIRVKNWNWWIYFWKKLIGQASKWQKIWKIENFNISFMSILEFHRHTKCSISISIRSVIEFCITCITALWMLWWLVSTVVF